MKTIDWLLNFVSLILWLKWLSFFSVPSRTTLSLAIVIKPAEPAPKRGALPVILIGLILFGKAILFRYFGALIKWSPTLDLIAISIPFRSDFLFMTLLYSILSFFLFLIVFYFWLCVLSVINFTEELDIYHRKIIQHLGVIGRLPALFRFFAPFIFCALLWLLMSPLFFKLGIVVKPSDFSRVLIQSGLLSLCILFSLKYLVIVLCALFLCYTYIYLGVHPFWSFIGITGKRLLKPLRWLRLGPIDLSPLAMSLLIAYLSLLGEKWFPLFYQRLLM
ncbi:MAG: hypothetical protein ACP5T0_00460 [Verrucomicrobiia bacterium]